MEEFSEPLARPPRVQGRDVSLPNSMGRPYTPANVVAASKTKEVFKAEFEWIPGEGMSEEPSTSDQMTNPKYAGLWHRTALSVSTFTLGPQPPDSGLTDQTKEFNEFLTQTEPTGAPRIELSANSRQWSERCGCWVVYVSYYRILYRKLMKEQRKEPPAEETP